MLNDTLGTEQQAPGGTFHSKNDLSQLARLNLNERQTVRETLDRLRALTTSDPSEAAWFSESGQVYRIQLRLVRVDDPD